MAQKAVNWNVELRDIPEQVSRVLGALARLRRVPKWVVVRDALVEYAGRHAKDLSRMASTEDI